MAFDAMPEGDPWGAFCRSCRQPIGSQEPVEEIRFTRDPERKLEELNGTYHKACARPFLSLAHINNMNPFGRF